MIPWWEKPFPRFGSPSKELREAVRMIHRERYAKAMAVRANGEWRLVDPPVSPTPELEAAMKLVTETGSRRLATLYEYFSLNRDLPGAGSALAYRLACQLIRGFDPYYIPPRGRPKSVRKDHGPLVQAVQEVQSRNPRVSIKRACVLLAKMDDRFKHKTPAELERAYHRYRAADEQIREQIGGYKRSE